MENIHLQLYPNAHVNIPNLISEPRFSTYLERVQNDPVQAIELYMWNLQMCCKLFPVLHFFEIGIRNAISEGIRASYGDNWAFSQAFHISLRKAGRYNPRVDIEALQNQFTCGKIIADLKFVFWEKMLTARHDQSIWNAHFNTCFPHSPPDETVQSKRAIAFHKVNRIRKLRNRIAHHEPIFERNLGAEYQDMIDLISWKCPMTANWIDGQHSPIDLLNARP